jgi:hypothetical protein
MTSQGKSVGISPSIPGYPPPLTMQRRGNGARPAMVRRTRHSLAHASDLATMHGDTGNEQARQRPALQGKKHKARAMEQWNSQRQHARDFREGWLIIKNRSSLVTGFSATRTALVLAVARG